MNDDMQEKMLQVLMSIQNNVNDMKTEIYEMKKDVSILKKDVETLKKKVKKLNENDMYSVSENKKLQKDVKELKQEVNDLKRNESKLSVQNDELRYLRQMDSNIILQILEVQKQMTKKQEVKYA